jgi:hypothetical protein
MRIKTRDRTIADCDVGLPIGPGTGPASGQPLAGARVDAPSQAQRRPARKDVAEPAPQECMETPVAKGCPEREVRNRRRAEPGPHRRTAHVD